MSKQYGLILPSQQTKPTTVSKAILKPSIFNESSSSDDDDRPQLKARSGAQQGLSLMERRIARTMQEKALKEDPTVFQYDELYDEMESHREQEQEKKSKEPKKPKYIGRLMEVAERRKLENELRVERQVQKEREQEGEEFKDKECFVTEAYRKKLEEMRQLQQKEKRDEYLEAIGDVTKQADLDGFYRHLYEQKLGTPKKVIKPESSAVALTEDKECNAYKPIRSGGLPQKRSYRKRCTTNDVEDVDDAESVLNSTKHVKKVHLSNNIDADSDFSIDSSSDENEQNDDGTISAAKTIKDDNELKRDSIEKCNSATTALNLNALNKEQSEKSVMVDDNKLLKKEGKSGCVEDGADLKTEIKHEKKDIWRKRTVGEVFQLAVQRYYERRAARNA